MASLRYTLLFIAVLLFSWPVIVTAELSPLIVWLYPFTVWLVIIVIALFSEINTPNERS